MENNEQQEEMNIFQVMNRVGRAIGGFFKSIFSYIGEFCRLMYKYKIVFLVLFVFAVGSLAVYLRRESKAAYAQMHVVINDGNMFVYENLINQLNGYLVTRQVDGLANALGITSELASKLQSFRYKHVIDENKDSIADWVDYTDAVGCGDSIVMKNQFILQVRMTSLDDCAEVQKSLVSYFSKNDYLASLNIARLASLEEREWMFHNALLNVDSLQKVDFFSKDPHYKMEFASKNEEDKPLLTTKREMYYDHLKNLFDINEKIAVDLSANLEVVTIVSDLQPCRVYGLADYSYVMFVKSPMGKMFIGIVVIILALVLFDRRKRVLKYLKEEE